MMKIDFEKKLEEIIISRKEKHIKNLGNIIDNNRFLIEKARFEKEYIYLNNKLNQMQGIENEDKLKLYRETLIYINSTV